MSAVGPWSPSASSSVLEKHQSEVVGVVQRTLWFPLKGLVGHGAAVCPGRVAGSVWTESPFSSFGVHREDRALLSLRGQFLTVVTRGRPPLKEENAVEGEEVSGRRFPVLLAEISTLDAGEWPVSLQTPPNAAGRLQAHTQSGLCTPHPPRGLSSPEKGFPLPCAASRCWVNCTTCSRSYQKRWGGSTRPRSQSRTAAQRWPWVRARGHTAGRPAAPQPPCDNLCRKQYYLIG